jgi:hypothetical protein
MPKAFAVLLGVIALIFRRVVAVGAVNPSIVSLLAVAVILSNRKVCDHGVRVLNTLSDSNLHRCLFFEIARLDSLVAGRAFAFLYLDALSLLELH